MSLLSDWKCELIELAERYPETGVLLAMIDLAETDQYGTLIWLRGYAIRKESEK